MNLFLLLMSFGGGDSQSLGPGAEIPGRTCPALSSFSASGLVAAGCSYFKSSV